MNTLEFTKVGLVSLKLDIEKLETDNPKIFFVSSDNLKPNVDNSYVEKLKIGFCWSLKNHCRCTKQFFKTVLYKKLTLKIADIGLIQFFENHNIILINHVYKKIEDVNKRYLIFVN